jgi:hypothetical protein
MDRADQALPSASALREGRRRLRLLLGSLGATACAAAMAVVLVFYGPPYNPLWWAAMAAIVLAAGVASGLCASAVEWVAKGYLERPAGD